MDSREEANTYAANRECSRMVAALDEQLRRRGARYERTQLAQAVREGQRWTAGSGYHAVVARDAARRALLWDLAYRVAASAGLTPYTVGVCADCKCLRTPCFEADVGAWQVCHEDDTCAHCDARHMYKEPPLEHWSVRCAN